MATGSSKIVFKRADGSSVVSSGGKSSEYLSPTTYESSPGPAGGQYVTQTINGKTYTSFVPANTKVYAGSKKRGNAQLVVDTTPAEAAPRTERLSYGPIRVSNNVPVSGSLFKSFEERRFGGPMSVREDVAYNVSTRTDRSALGLRVVDQSVDINAGVRSGSSKGFVGDKSNSFMDSQINFLVGWEKEAGKRSAKVDDFFIRGIEQSPFRDKRDGFVMGDGRAGRPLNFVEEVGARGMALPAHFVTTVPESLALSAGKAIVFSEAFFFDGYRQRANVEEKRAFKAVPGVVASSFDVRKPSGVVNLAGAFAAPSFYGKVVNTVKSVAYIGKTKIPVEQTVDPRVLSGKQRFPTSRGTAKDLKVEFDRSPYVANVNSVIKQSSPAADTFVPNLGVVGKAKAGALNVAKGSKGRVSSGLPPSGSKVLYVDNWGTNYVVERPAPAPVRGGFTAAPTSLKTSKGVLPGSSATKGGYIAPSLSKYFLKIKGSERTVKVGLFPSLQTPSANLINTKVGLIPGKYVQDAEMAAGFRIGLGGSQSRVPKTQRPAAIREMNKYFDGELAGSGKAAVSPEFMLGKTESESIVGSGSGLKDLKPNYNVWDRITGFKYYQEIDGARVPLRIIEATPTRPGGIKGFIDQRLAERSLASSERIGVTEFPVMGFSGSRGSRGGSRSRGGSSYRGLPSSSVAPSISSSIPISRGPSGSVGRMPSIGGGDYRFDPVPSIGGGSGSGGSRSRNLISSFGSSQSYAPVKMTNFGLTTDRWKGLPGIGSSRKESSRKSRLVPFSPKYFASIEATALGIKGKPNKKSSIVAGLDIRPMRF